MKYLILVFMFFTYLSCTESPEKTLVAVNASIKEKNIEKYLDFFTENSKKLITELLKTDKDTRGVLKFFKDPFSILPEGKIIETKVDNNKKVAIIAVKDRGKAEKITMVKQNGKWKIDLALLNKFYNYFKEN